MVISATIARRSDGTVATEHHAKMSRTYRSQVIADGVRSLIRAVVRTLSGPAAQAVRQDDRHLRGRALGA